MSTPSQDYRHALHAYAQDLTDRDTQARRHETATQIRADAATIRQQAQELALNYLGDVPAPNPPTAVTDDAGPDELASRAQKRLDDAQRWLAHGRAQAAAIEQIHQDIEREAVLARQRAAVEEEQRKAFAKRAWQIGGVTAALMLFMASGYLFLVPLFAAWHLSRPGWDPDRRSRAAVAWAGYVFALWWIIDTSIKGPLENVNLPFDRVWVSTAVGFAGAALLWRLTPIQQPHRKEGA